MENYKQNNDINQYINISWINYESYDSSNNVIYRSEKKAICVKFINDLLDNNMVNEKNYSFLLPYKYYFEKNEKTLEKLDSLIILPYKALFEIK